MHHALHNTGHRPANSLPHNVSVSKRAIVNQEGRIPQAVAGLAMMFPASNETYPRLGPARSAQQITASVRESMQAVPVMVIPRAVICHTTWLWIKLLVAASGGQDP